MMGNIYSYPGEYGLEIIGQAEEPGLSYEFDMFVVWRSKEDPSKLYWAADSGCSCPSPFEEYYSVESLHGPSPFEEYYSVESLHGPGTPHHAHIALDEWVNEYEWNSESRRDGAVELHAKLAAL